MIFQWKCIHGSVCKFLIFQSSRIKTIIFTIILQEFFYIYKHSCINQFLAIRICVNINDIRHISTCNQCFQFLQI